MIEKLASKNATLEEEVRRSKTGNLSAGDSAATINALKAKVRERGSKHSRSQQTHILTDCYDTGEIVVRRIGVPKEQIPIVGTNCGEKLTWRRGEASADQAHVANSAHRVLQSLPLTIYVCNLVSARQWRINSISSCWWQRHLQHHRIEQLLHCYFGHLATVSQEQASLFSGSIRRCSRTPSCGMARGFPAQSV